MTRLTNYGHRPPKIRGGGGSATMGSTSTVPMEGSFKGCVRYLNRCKTSPTQILYQLREKNELTISYYIFFYLRHFHCWKFSLATYWNALTNPASTVTELLSITLKNEILQKSIFYRKIFFDNLIRLFSRKFCQNTFYSFIHLQGIVTKILYFQ